jgi:hypothetical protein
MADVIAIVKPFIDVPQVAENIPSASGSGRDEIAKFSPVPPNFRQVEAALHNSPASRSDFRFGDRDEQFAVVQFQLWTA